ncbi:MAG: hypothetical protein RMZ43_008445 [Nostoc sp. CmiVER01]|uniref:hypothetical protein n=1 Tax=Nostoc sp. CmiVER01 TaxID=3075384 RepID=UPI002AD351FD|nr:hypothetical protein [Nostoc sp. CmiVER01]MDZ8126540.1 hypothetical protein [Nostoc sp. CmiVER01]
MAPFQPTRRRFIKVAGGVSFLTLLGCNRREQAMLTLYTFGDSILDCGRYNEYGVHPGQLLIQNDDRLFPEFQDPSWFTAMIEPSLRGASEVRRVFLSCIVGQ